MNTDSEAIMLLIRQAQARLRTAREVAITRSACKLIDAAHADLEKAAEHLTMDAVNVTETDA